MNTILVSLGAGVFLVPAIDIATGTLVWLVKGVPNYLIRREGLLIFGGVGIIAILLGVFQ